MTARLHVSPVDWPWRRRVLRFAGGGLAGGIALSMPLLLYGDPASDRTFTALSPTGTAPLWANVVALLILGVAGGIALALLVPLYRFRYGAYMIGPLVALLASTPVALTVWLTGADLGYTRTYEAWQLNIVLLSATVLLSGVGVIARPFVAGESPGVAENSRPVT